MTRTSARRFVFGTCMTWIVNAPSPFVKVTKTTSWSPNPSERTPSYLPVSKKPTLDQLSLTLRQQSETLRSNLECLSRLVTSTALTIASLKSLNVEVKCYLENSRSKRQSASQDREQSG